MNQDNGNVISIGNSSTISGGNGDLSSTNSNEPVIHSKTVNIERNSNDQYSHQNNKNEDEEDKIQIEKMSESNAKSDTEKFNVTVDANEKDYNEEKELQRASKVFWALFEYNLEIFSFSMFDFMNVLAFFNRKSIAKIVALLSRPLIVMY